MSVSRHSYTLLLAAAAALGTGIVLLHGATYGPGLHWDSVNYIGVARNLLAGEGWVEFHREAYARWAPLYPALLAAPGLLGFDPRAVAGPLNALLFGLTIFAAGHWLWQRIASRLLALWGCLAIVLAPPLIEIASWAFSEPAFILFVTLALFYMDQYLRDGKRAALIGAALFTALACLTRYIGFPLIIILLSIMLLQPGLRLLEKVKRGAVFTLISMIPISLWLLYNLLRLGSPVGYKPPRFIPPLEFLDISLPHLGEWFLPDLPQEYTALLTAAILLALVIAIGLVFARASRRPALYRGWSFFCLCGGFILVYLIAVGAVSMRLEIDLASSRYWTPIYIPLLFALVFLLDRFLIWLRTRKESAVRLPMIAARVRVETAVLGILFFIWLGNAVELNRQAVIIANEHPNNNKQYASSYWVDNDVIHFMREAQVKIPVLSNDIAGVYIHADSASAFGTLPYELEQLKRKVELVAEDGSYLVWLDPVWAPNRLRGYGTPELEAVSGLELVARLEGGLIFRINRGQ